VTASHHAPTPFRPIRTDRLLLRPVRPEDAAALADRRSEPEVAAWQSWTAPFPLERAQTLVTEISAMQGPVDGEWWMVTIADLDDREVLGELVLHPTWDFRSVEVGYTLARSAWGRGHAVEALDALLDWLWTWPRLTRVHAGLHPDNIASAQVLERTGFRFEGRTALSYWLEDDNSDDWLYGMTRADLDAWRGRPRTPPAVVELIPVTPGNARDVLRAVTHKSQERFVAPTLQSFADALVPELHDGAPVVPWYRGIAADGEIVGFVMVTAITEAHPHPYLWRLLVDRRHQRRGIGDRVLDAVVAEMRAWGAERLEVSWGDGRGSPAPFYLRRGFTPTGALVDGEVEAVLPLG
jgi:RimJ/RimL family protein N-acetyltransferase